MPFYPKAIDKDLVFSGLVILGILACAAYFGPKGPRGIPNPTYIDTAPAPDFFFLWIYAALALLPPYMETFFCSPRRWLGLGFSLRFLLFPTPGKECPPPAHGRVGRDSRVPDTRYLDLPGDIRPVGSHMEAWTSVPTPVQYVHGRSPLELQGALVLQNKQCRNCHGLGGEGGLRGPALDGVATRLTGDQLIRQVIQGGGNMPAFGKNLAPQEVTALVAFMQTLRPANVPAAPRPGG